MVPNGWKKGLLDEGIELISGQHVEANCVNNLGVGIPYLTGPADFPNGKIVVTKFTNEGKKFSKKGDLLITVKGSGTGKVIESDNEYAISRQLMAIRPKTFDSKFVYYNLVSSLGRYEDAAAGLIPGISREDVLHTPLLIPPIDEQMAIAQILSTWDQVISVTEKLLENSQQQKKALMQQLLTGKKRLFDENGVRFVGEWEKVHIKDCAECLDNKRVPLNSEQRSSMSGTIPYWGANGIVDYISDFIFDETIVLLAEDGGYFDEYQTRPISNISYGKCWVNNHAHILRAKKNSLNEWIYYCLVHKNILAFVNGGTRAKLNKSDMLMIPLLLPSLQEQKKIVSVLSLADQEIENLQKKLDCLKQEKKALMQQLLTGKKRVKVAA